MKMMIDGSGGSGGPKGLRRKNMSAHISRWAAQRAPTHAPPSGTTNRDIGRIPAAERLYNSHFLWTAHKSADQTPKGKKEEMNKHEQKERKNERMNERKEGRKQE
jgi:hypothetical protein